MNKVAIVVLTKEFIKLGGSVVAKKLMQIKAESDNETKKALDMENFMSALFTGENIKEKNITDSKEFKDMVAISEAIDILSEKK